MSHKICPYYYGEIYEIYKILSGIFNVWTRLHWWDLSMYDLNGARRFSQQGKGHDQSYWHCKVDGPKMLLENVGAFRPGFYWSKCLVMQSKLVFQSSVPQSLLAYGQLWLRSSLATNLFTQIFIGYGPLWLTSSLATDIKSFRLSSSYTSIYRLH